MSVTLLKSQLATQLATVTGIGTIDQDRKDPDDLPREARGTTAYWDLRITGSEDRPAQMGMAAGTRHVFRTYALRLEGWKGFVGHADATATWETLVESAVNKLHASQATMAANLHTAGATGFESISNLRAEVDIVKLGENTRYHHAVVTGDILFFKVLS